MIEITERRLKVRNDGNGTARDQDARFSDFNDEDAVVILGNPGMGKTTLLRTVSGGFFSSVRTFVANPVLDGKTTLFLDGLDEFRILAKGEEVTTRVAAALCSLGKPRFRLSCRAADWFGSSDLEVLRTASASGRIAILEILPLNSEENRYEVRTLFEEWFERRLANDQPIDPSRLAGWLRTILGGHCHNAKDIRVALKGRFVRQPGLFEATFDIVSIPDARMAKSGRVHLAYDLWTFLPTDVWPSAPYEFLLARAKSEPQPEKSADLFGWYVSTLPKENTPSQAVEMGFQFMNERPEVATALGQWNVCPIPKWRKEQTSRNKKRAADQAQRRAENIAYLESRISSIRDGSEEQILLWSVPIYLDLYYDLEEGLTPKGRLESLSDGAIADAIIEGFGNYLTRASVLPSTADVVQAWVGNQLPHKHSLVALSVFHCTKRGEAIPKALLAPCFATVLTALRFDNKTLPEFDETTFAWMCDQLVEHPQIVGPVVESVWTAGAKGTGQRLRRFDELRDDSRLASSLASIAKNVLSQASGDDRTVIPLLSYLLEHDQNYIRQVGQQLVSGGQHAGSIRAIWITALFVVDPIRHLNLWRSLQQAPEIELRNALSFLAGNKSAGITAVPFVPVQRREIVTLFGARFSSEASLPSEFSGGDISWDASNFVARQLEQLASDPSEEAGDALEALAENSRLESYHDLIHHQISQRDNRLRQTTFAFARAEDVAAAIENKAPATGGDLLAYIVDHIVTLAKELRATQVDKFHAYWNQTSSKGLDRPKHEEECSALFADALQGRVQAHGLKVVVEHHMVNDKECDIVVLQGVDRLLPIEVKHHYNDDLWTGWRIQLDELYAHDADAGALGIYLVFWSGEGKDRKIRKPPGGLARPTSAAELLHSLESQIPDNDRHRLRVLVVDISPL